MSDTPRDALDEFLERQAFSEDDTRLRGRVMDRTIGVLRRRRVVRRVRLVGALLLCAAAGAGAAWLAKPEPSIEPQRVQIVVPQPKANEPKAKEEAKAPEPPAVVEWRAFDAERAAKVHLYRDAGDRYLAQHNLEGALRCYRQALDAGGETELTENPADTWLLTSLKEARRKERSHANAGS